ncbi:autotransporter domain-containing protein [Methylobacterium sp. E-065]|uniref:autotransporter domain-containing protein n=1 Tax=Methylobacterium sp. E-065 TaxID=2836583 RepID=UPI001FBB9017|nr:autotransporter domain-containing protein [Methylobacterium sp. E-065]MCJ2021927.1 autotransporter domain-containing protein [Methylobacterium sp. E-065]
MKSKLASALLTCSALTAATPVFAQMLDPLLPSLNTATAPTFPASVPNGGQPLPQVRAITGFGTVYDFGSSSSDTRSSTPVLPGYGTRWSNGNAIFVEMVSPLIGAINRSGSTAPLASPTPTNFAQAGNTSATTAPQIAQFSSAYGRFAPNDIAIQFTGINDFSAGNINAATVNGVSALDVTNQTQSVRQLIGLGARNVVVLNLPDSSTFNYFTRNLGAATSDPNALRLGSQLVNAGLASSLADLHAQTGANIHLFDTNLLVNQIRANPSAYGFSAFGVQPNVNCASLLGLTPASCPSNANFAVQNQFLSWDGIHYTNRFHEVLTQAIANQLIAPYTIAPQAEIADVTARAFGNSLLLRLDAYRAQNTPSIVPTGYTADLPGRAPPPVPMAVLLGNPVSLFAEGGYANGGRDSRVGAPGFDYDAPSVTVGAEYRARPDLLLGGAFNFSSASVNLTSLGQIGATRIDVDTYQFAGFASLNRPDWFADLVVGYGFNDFVVSRSGIVGRLESKPVGNTLLVAAKAAYLFDFGSFRIGPVGTLTYAHTWIDAYQEQGDPLLNQAVRRQDTDGLSGGAGIQVRLPFALGGRIINPFVNVTAEHDFLGQLRTITTAQTYVLSLPISTSIRGYDGGTYGRVAAGISFDIGGGLSAMVNGSATFARANGDEFGVNGGFRYRF